MGHWCATLVLDSLSMTERTPIMATSIDYSKFGPHEATFRAVMAPLEEVSVTHDDLLVRLSIKKGEINEEILENARIRNRNNNKQVTTFNEQIGKLEEKLSELKEKAYSLVEDTLPKELTDEEKVSVKARIKDLRDQFKSKSLAVETIAEAVGVSLEGITLPSIATNGVRVSGSGATKVGHNGPRLRMDAVTVNGNVAEAPNPNDKTKTSSNFTIAAAVISKKLGLSVAEKITATDIQSAYFAKAGTEDVTQIPHTLEFEFPFTKADKSVETFVISATRSIPGESKSESTKAEENANA